MSAVGGQDSAYASAGAPPRTSVCMATYNGADYVVEQLDSILRQLGPDDEVVVVDDASTDDTVTVIADIDDPRVRLHVNPANAGHVATFEEAIRQARGQYILLADQDDLWPDGRVATMLTALESGVAVAGNQQEFPRPRPVRPAHIDPSMNGRPARNLMMLLLGRQPYFGCAMGLRRDLLPVLLPFPANVESHDHWIGVVGNMSGGIEHVDDVLVMRRVHENNQTPAGRRPLPVVLRSRLWMLVDILRAARRSRALRARTTVPLGSSA